MEQSLLVHTTIELVYSSQSQLGNVSTQAVRNLYTVDGHSLKLLYTEFLQGSQP